MYCQIVHAQSVKPTRRKTIFVHQILSWGIDRFLSGVLPCALQVLSPRFVIISLYLSMKEVGEVFNMGTHIVTISFRVRPDIQE